MYAGARAEKSVLNGVCHAVVEGLFLYQRNVDPYDGGVNFHSPLLVLSFAAVPAGVFQTALFSLADCLIGWTIYGIARLQHVQNPLALLMWYLFNPINIASCVSMNTATFATLASVFALSAALESHAYVAIVWLVVATSLALWPVVLLIPLMMLNAKTDLRAQRPVVAFAKQTAAFVLALGAILVFFRYQFASWLYLRCYGAQLSLPDLSPNVGLWWYFFTEIFDSYRDFFLCVFTLHVIIYAAPITIRLSSDPLFSFVAVLGLTSVFKSYPTVGEHSVVLHLLFLFPDAFSRKLAPLHPTRNANLHQACNTHFLPYPSYFTVSFLGRRSIISGCTRGAETRTFSMLSRSYTIPGSSCFWQTSFMPSYASSGTTTIRTSVVRRLFKYRFCV